MLGAGPLVCRVCLSNDGRNPIGSVHNFLRWLQVDKDDEHNDWKHWLRVELEESLDQDRSDLTDPDPTDFVLEYHKFDGIETPMGNVKVFERLVRLCVGKSKIANGVADCALSLWTEKLAESPELSEEARDFLRPPKKRQRCSDDELVVRTMQNYFDDKFKSFDNKFGQLVKQEDIKLLSQSTQETEKHMATMATTLAAFASNVASVASRSVCHALSQKFIDVQTSVRKGIDQMLKPKGPFVAALHRATKLPAKKSNPDSANFPAAQRATSEQLSLYSVPLSVVVADLMLKPYRTPVGVVLPGKRLTYGAWLAIRNLIGKRCKRLRLRDDDAPQPLRWAYTGPCGPAGGGGGGARYIYTGPESLKYVSQALRERAPLLAGRQAEETIFRRIRFLIDTCAPEQWPEHSSELEPSWSRRAEGEDHPDSEDEEEV